MLQISFDLYLDLGTASVKVLDQVSYKQLFDELKVLTYLVTSYFSIILSLQKVPVLLVQLCTVVILQDMIWEHAWP